MFEEFVYELVLSCCHILNILNIHACRTSYIFNGSTKYNWYINDRITYLMISYLNHNLIVIVGVTSNKFCKSHNSSEYGLLRFPQYVFPPAKFVLMFTNKFWNYFAGPWLSFVFPSASKYSAIRIANVSIWRPIVWEVN